MQKAMDEHDDSIQNIQKSFEPPKLLFDDQNNVI